MTKPADHFETLEILGSTSSSVVIKGRHFQSGLVTAVKMARVGAAIQKRFSREVEAMRVAAGPSVMPVLEADVDGDWYTMPLATRELTKASASLSVEAREELACETVRVVADALREFHRRGQVHRDLKPQNILWLDDDGEGRWVVSDFGIARNTPGSTTSQLTQAGGLLGTTGWAAPELHLDAHMATSAADVYSLGAIVAWILTGSFPSISSVPRPAGRFRSVVVRATRTEPTRRYSTIDLMVAAMESEIVSHVGPLSSQFAALMKPPVSYDALSNFLVTHSDNPELLLAELPSLSSADLNSWFLVDAEGLLEVAERVSGMLQDEQGRAGLRQEGLRPPLSWLLSVLRIVVGHNRAEAAERLSIGFFEALEACDQWPVSQEAATWFKGLNTSDAEVMIAAAKASTAEHYLLGYLADSWTTPKSDVVRRWLT
ncbi:serine/threonine protein kinase [Arthrobacter sp. PvP023]|uniref:serine/threonine-protein kinase n=1 Tax=Micrococcaceae TaxID=1268 RepID=UPI001AEB9A16|nr:serine/threonine-protein kinase [Arthrobacter sp. PvP023]MBP1134614.1 serine/threonine protein kinase [Arthrobacter sp. PvP023]